MNQVKQCIVQKQKKSTSTLLLNKTQLISPEKQRIIMDQIAQFNKSNSFPITIEKEIKIQKIISIYFLQIINSVVNKLDQFKGIFQTTISTDSQQMCIRLTFEYQLQIEDGCQDTVEMVVKQFQYQANIIYKVLEEFIRQQQQFSIKAGHEQNYSQKLSKILSKQLRLLQLQK